MPDVSKPSHNSKEIQKGETMHRGYVKMWRKSMDHPMMGNPKLWQFWCYCLMKANYKPTQAVIGFQTIDLESGQFIFGRKAAARALGLSEQTIRSSLRYLKTAGNVTIKPTNKYSIITVLNWELYQSEDVEATSMATDERQTNGKQTANKRPHQRKLRKLRIKK